MTRASRVLAAGAAGLLAGAVSACGGGGTSSAPTRARTVPRAPTSTRRQPAITAPTTGAAATTSPGATPTTTTDAPPTTTGDAPPTTTGDAPPTTTTSAPPTTTTSTSPEQQPGGGGDEEAPRVPARFTYRDGRLTPPLITVPAAFRIALSVVLSDGRPHVVTAADRRLRVERSVASALLPGLRKTATLAIAVDGRAAGRIVSGLVAGP